MIQRQLATTSSISPGHLGGRAGEGGDISDWRQRAHSALHAERHGPGKSVPPDPSGRYAQAPAACLVRAVT